MIHVACQILYSPVQSVTLCVQDDACSVSVTVQFSTVSSAGCVRPYVNINSKTGWLRSPVQFDRPGILHSNTGLSAVCGGQYL